MFCEPQRQHFEIAGKGLSCIRTALSSSTTSLHATAPAIIADAWQQESDTTYVRVPFRSTVENILCVGHSNHIMDDFAHEAARPFNDVI